MLEDLIRWFTSERAEHPNRLTRFRTQVQALTWTKDAALTSLTTLHEAVDELAMAEVRYYYRRRTSRARLSGVLRFLAWVFGAGGVLAPLLSAAHPDLKAAGSYGYVLLALAAVFLSANALFGGTSGHVRFVSAQLEIERVMTTSRLAWRKFVARVESNSIPVDEVQKDAFLLLDAYAEALYKLTISETGAWAQSIIAELEKFHQQIDRQKHTSGKPTANNATGGTRRREATSRRKDASKPEAGTARVEE